MKKNYFFLTLALLLCFSINGYSQEKSNKFWNIVKDQGKPILKKTIKDTKPDQSKIFRLNIDALKSVLKNTSQRDFKISNQGVIIDFPNSDGKIEEYSVYEASVMHPNLQKRYSNIRSYVGKGIDNPSAIIRFSVSHLGLKSMTLSSGEFTVFIEPYSEDLTQYIVYDKKAKSTSTDAFECLVMDKISGKIKSDSELLTRPNADDGILRTYRLAMSATAEFTQYFGGTKADALAAINATMTRVNGVYEVDFNVNMVLIANTDDVIYTNTATDPYGGTTNNYNSELQATLTSVIGEANYDIGHLVANLQNNGNAGCIGCVCVDNQKGSGWTSHTVPEGDNFDIDYVAHEMGHQFGGNHTWTHNGNEFTNVQMEPGSGSTIMGYAGITGATDIQAHSDAYFHAISIEQITDYVKSTSCQINTATGNNIPTALAGLDYTIPKSTPFILSGDGTDADGDTLTFCWEQMDENNASTTYPSSTETTGVAFRSFLPTTSKSRYFPAFSTVLNGNVSNQWESVPEVSRALNFRLTTRDNVAGGGTNNSDDMVVTIDDSKGPLEITSQNSSGVTWLNGASETITWNVNSTNALSGAANVNILLSIDGGISYPTTLVSNTPNDGSVSITVPNTPAPFCRIMIQPTSSIFYAINTVDFSIDYSVVTTCTTYTATPNLAITDNSGSFDTTGLNVPDNVTISDVNINLAITHTYLGDLLIAVLSPDGTQVNMFENKCTSNNNMDVLFDDSGTTLVCASPTTGTFTPSNLLSILNGEASIGTWTLGVNDSEIGDTGTVDSWSVEICSTVETPLAVKEFEFNQFSVFPNPSSGLINISLLSNSSENVVVNLFDLTGRLISKKIFKSYSSQFNEEIDFGNLGSGIYLLKVKKGTQESSKQLVIY